MTLKFINTLMVTIGFVFLPGCQVVVQKSIPAAGTVKYESVVYAENDGRCSAGEVLKITGGHQGKDIPRIYECVSRP